MGNRVLDDFTAAWPADPSGRWVITVSGDAANLGADGSGMSIVASAAATGSPTPFAQRDFAPSLDLRDSLELRFTIRSDRPATGAPSSPYFLVLEAGTGTTVGWHRFVAVPRPNTWTLQRFVLTDMPDSLRQAVGFLRLRSLDPTVAFTAAVDDLAAGTPQVLQDVETVLLSRLNRRFTVTDGTTDVVVPALMNVPENPGTQTLPYVLISPWSVLPETERQGDEEIDNYSEAGAYVRPSPQQVRLEYRIDVHASNRAQKAFLLESIVANLANTPRLVVFDEAISVVPFRPDPLAEGPTAPGVTPLYYRLTPWFEAGPRVFRPLAAPFLALGQPATPPEYVSP